MSYNNCLVRILVLVGLGMLLHLLELCHRQMSLKVSDIGLDFYDMKPCTLLNKYN